MAAKATTMSILSKVRLVKIVILFLLANSALLDATADEYQALLARLDNIQAQHKIPAYALVITSQQQTLLDEVRGIASSGGVTPVSPEAYFRIGSITKVFIGLAALQAQNQMKLDLNDSIEKHLSGQGYSLPKFQQQYPNVRQLLEHTAGLQDMSRIEFDSNQPLTLHQALRVNSMRHQLAWLPGYAYSYSNTGYGYVGRVIEMTTKQNINDWLTQSVFRPLSMDSATMELTQEVSKGLVPGYQKDGVEPIPYWHMVYSSLGAINLQPRDMAKLIRFYLGKSVPGIPAKLIRQQQSPKTSLAARYGLTYGYGAGLYQWFRHGHLFYGHGGDADGYLSHFGYQKQAGKGYFLVINTFNGTAKNTMRKVVEEFLVRDLPVVSEKGGARKGPFKTQNHEDLSGDYLRLTSRFGKVKTQQPLQLKWKNQRLLIREPGEEWDELVQVSDNLFRRSYESQATTAIVEFNGKVWLQGDEGNWVRTKSRLKND